MGQSVGQLLQTEISQQQLGGLSFCTDIHDLQKMNPTDFPSSATMRLTFVFLSKMSQQLLQISMKFGTDYLLTFFYLVPPSGQTFSNILVI